MEQQRPDCSKDRGHVPVTSAMTGSESTGIPVPSREKQVKISSKYSLSSLLPNVLPPGGVVFGEMEAGSFTSFTASGTDHPDIDLL